MPAGLLAMMLGSSVDAAAPAKALPIAEVLFSRNWNPEPQPSPKSESPIPAVASEAASSLNFASTAPSVIVNFFEDAAQRSRCKGVSIACQPLGPRYSFSPVRYGIQIYYDSAL